MGQPRIGPNGLERKTAAALALIGLETGICRARLSSLLWPDALGKTARGNLRQLLKRLRDSVGQIIVGGAVLQLESSISVDALTDVPLGGGELLGECDYDDCPELSNWLVVQREYLRNRSLSAMSGRADQIAREGRTTAAFDAAMELLRVHPESEAAHRRVIRLWYLRGDLVGALQSFEACQRLIRRLCDADVSAETRALGETIQAERAVELRLESRPGHAELPRWKHGETPEPTRNQPSSSGPRRRGADK